MKPKVSLVMIVKDEALSLVRCLHSARDLFGEIVVVDTGSTDLTPEVAQGFGARVIDFPWTESFAEARNESLRHARGRWAFWLDADEWLEPEARELIAALIAGLDDSGAETVYLMRQASDFVTSERDEFSILQPRLFPIVDEVRWQYRVHEQILETWRLRGASICPTPVVIRHSGYQTLEQTASKDERNLRLMILDLEDRPDDPWACFQLGRSYLERRFPEAELLFRRAMASSDATPLTIRQIHPMLVRGYREAGDSEQARRTALEGLSRFPDDSILLFESGCFLLEDGQLDQAAQVFERLLTEPADPEEVLVGSYGSLRGWRARNHLALVRVRQGRADQAGDLWRAALADQPDAVPAWLGLGELLMAQARWLEFDPVVEQLQGLAPLDPRVGLLRAQGDLARREFGRARAVLKELVECDPAAIDPKLLLGWCFLMEGRDLPSARRWLSEVLQIAPGHPEAVRGLKALGEGTL